MNDTEMREPAEVLRGVIDRLESDWAVLALDDGQQLNWPVHRLPRDAHPGAAILLQVDPQPNDLKRDQANAFQGRVCYRAPGPSLVIHFGVQRLAWPTTEQRLSGDVFLLRLDIDHRDTVRRQQRVQDLIDDLFG